MESIIYDDVENVVQMLFSLWAHLAFKHQCLG
jgi:hypothetical protein